MAKDRSCDGCWQRLPVATPPAERLSAAPRGCHASLTAARRGASAGQRMSRPCGDRPQRPKRRRSNGWQPSGVGDHGTGRAFFIRAPLWTTEFIQPDPPGQPSRHTEDKQTVTAYVGVQTLVFTMALGAAVLAVAYMGAPVWLIAAALVGGAAAATSTWRLARARRTAARARRQAP